MTSLGPLYFFDQPTRRSVVQGRRGPTAQRRAPKEGPQRPQARFPEHDRREVRGERRPRPLGDEPQPAEPRLPGPRLAEPLTTRGQDPVEVYKRTAPHLLNELARVLALHRWPEAGRLPQGIANLLSYSWQDFAADPERPPTPRPPDRRRKAKGGSKMADAPCRRPERGRVEPGTGRALMLGHVSPCDRKPPMHAFSRSKRRKCAVEAGPSSSTFRFSISSCCCKGPGRIVQPEQPFYDARQRLTLCRWVVERLQTARNSGKTQTSKGGLNKLPILRHYGDTKASWRAQAPRSRPASLFNGLPQIPEMKPFGPVRRKLYYRIDDGSSFIYYPSGCMAVCQSSSCLPCGGFYTNVFSDSDCPVILATITMFGHGAVTHPISCAITAVWDQDGGFLCDHYGQVTKEWNWQTGMSLRAKVNIQLSELISVQLLSGTSASLSFRSGNESVQLQLSAVSKKLSTKEMEVLQMATDVEELSGTWRRGGLERELKRLQWRAQNTMEAWMEYYREAIGIGCLNHKWLASAPRRAGPGPEGRPVALPALPDSQLQGEGFDPLERPTPMSVGVERPVDKLLRTSRKKSKEEPGVLPVSSVQIHRDSKMETIKMKTEDCGGLPVRSLQINRDIKFESVMVPNPPALQASSLSGHLAQAAMSSSAPLTVCPPLLRAALLGEAGPRRCCCSSAAMPVLTDLEYDAFITGQPPHSQQILVVCVTLHADTDAALSQDPLEELYRQRNKHRVRPCTQCQTDSFRLVRYEISTGRTSYGVKNTLLQQRHNAAPGMILMYIRGKLLFLGYIISGHCCSIRDLQRQISRARGDYRLGLSLPPDYKFSETANASLEASLMAGADITLSGKAETEKPGETYVFGVKMTLGRSSHIPGAGRQRPRDFCIRPKKTAALPHVAVH